MDDVKIGSQITLSREALLALQNAFPNPDDYGNPKNPFGPFGPGGPVLREALSGLLIAAQFHASELNPQPFPPPHSAWQAYVGSTFSRIILAVDVADIAGGEAASERASKVAQRAMDELENWCLTLPIPVHIHGPHPWWNVQLGVAAAIEAFAKKSLPSGIAHALRQSSQRICEHAVREAEKAVTA